MQLHDTSRARGMDLCGRSRVLCDIGCSRDYVDGQPVVVSGIDRMMIDRGVAETGIRTIILLDSKIPPLKSIQYLRQ